MKPVFLIGAARSGTKLLRDLLAEHPDVGAVPFDVNYLWRLGREDQGDDSLCPPLASQARMAVERELAKAGGVVVVEKTVSNCLRVPAIAAAFPEADFVMLVRDGLDVTESALRQWQAPIDFRYSIKKALDFPWLRAPGYALKHLRSSLLRTRSTTTTTWGPRYEGIDDDVASLPLIETCARQWSASITQACLGFEQAEIRPLLVRYEELVADPLSVVNRIHAMNDLEPVRAIERTVKSAEVGKGRRSLSGDDLDLIRPVIDRATARLDEWIGRP